MICRNVMTSKYFMEHINENNRLTRKTNPDEVVYRYLQNHIHQFQCCFLDIGCGPCIIDKSISKIFKNITIHCADISPDRVFQAKEKIRVSNIKYACADANKLPYKNSCFDIVFARFLFEYMKKPEKVISELIRVCRSGGKIILQDLDGQLLFHYPEYTSLNKRMKHVIDLLAEDYGFDPFVGRKLYHFCAKNGLIDIQVNVEPYHLIYGKISNLELQNWQHKLSILLPKMEKALGTSQQAIALKNDCLEYLKQEDTLLYSNLFSLIAIKP